MNFFERNPINEWKNSQVKEAMSFEDPDKRNIDFDPKMIY